VSYAVLCTTGLAAEAKIARGAGFAVVVGGGNRPRTTALVEAAAPQATCLVSFGIAGALAPGLRPGDLILSTEVVEDDRRWLTSEAFRLLVREFGRQVGATEGPVLGARVVVASEADKRRAWRETGAIAVDLESAVVARVSAALGIPFVVLRAIADPATRELPPAALVPLRPDGKPQIGQVLASVMRRPQQLRPLLGVARETRRALGALAAPVRALNALLGSLELRHSGADVI